MNHFDTDIMFFNIIDFRVELRDGTDKRIRLLSSVLRCSFYTFSATGSLSSPLGFPSFGFLRFFSQQIKRYWVT